MATSTGVDDSLDPDPFLISSLKRDQKRRRQRFTIITVLVAMLSLIAIGGAMIFKEFNRPAWKGQTLTRAKSPANPAAVARALEAMRTAVVAYSLDFDEVFPDRTPATFDLKRLDHYRGPGTWPQILGREPIGAAESYESSTGDRAPDAERVLFTSPLVANYLSNAYSTILCTQGVGKPGSIFEKSYAMVYVAGPMEGEVHFSSYGTLVVDGDVSGGLVCESYFNAAINGSFSGTLQAKSYAMIRIANDFTGTAQLEHSTIVIGGKANRSQLEKIEGVGRVFVRKSDLPAGVTQLGGIRVIVQAETP